MEYLITVVTKVLVILALIMIGYIITKRGILTERGATEVTSILVKVVTPCVIIASFIGSERGIKISQLLLSAFVAAISIFISIGLSYLFFRKEKEARQKVLRFSVIFCNVGFMGIPLVQGIVGKDGVIFASFYIAVFNVIAWTYGYRLMNSDAKLNLKMILFNPGIIGLAIGLPIYFLNLQLPVIVKEPIQFMADLNTPMAMLIVGSYIAKVELKSFITDMSVYKMSFLRLILSPAIFFIVLLILRPTPALFTSAIIQSSTPVAASAVLFAVQFKKDYELASKSVAVSTILSVLTIPLFAILSQVAIAYLY